LRREKVKPFKKRLGMNLKIRQEWQIYKKEINKIKIKRKKRIKMLEIYSTMR
jgi:hypothetical protein